MLQLEERAHLIVVKRADPAAAEAQGGAGEVDPLSDDPRLQVGEAIGVLPTIALLILDSLLGAMLMRSQGRRAWVRFNMAVSEGRVPAREAIDGLLVVFGGALLLTPGFVSDIFGAIFLLSLIHI